MSKAIFLVGAPGSGKDFLLRNDVLGNRNLVEMSLDKITHAIASKQDIPELAQFPSLIINGNAERQADISISEMVLKTMGYETSMLYVYTTDEASKARNDARRLRGNKTFTEEQRIERYNNSISLLSIYEETFKPFWLFNNSENFTTFITEELKGWLFELKNEVTSFLGEDQKYSSMAAYNHSKHPPQAPTTDVQHTSIIKGYERVKNHQGRWVLRKKQVSETDKYNSLNKAFETYTATAVDNSRGNIRVSDNGSPTENPATVMAKVLKPNKKTSSDTQGGIRIPDQNRADPPVWESKEKVTPDGQRVEMPTQKRKNKKTVSATPPPDFFDGRMGMVPSGSLGLTSDYKPSGTALSELRKRMRK